MNDPCWEIVGKGEPPYSRAAAGATWRLSFALLIPVVIYFLYYRVFILKELTALDRNKKKNNVKGKNSGIKEKIARHEIYAAFIFRSICLAHEQGKVFYMYRIVKFFEGIYKAGIPFPRQKSI